MKIQISRELLTEIGIRSIVFLIILFTAFVIAKVIKKLMLRKQQFLRIDKTKYLFVVHFISGMFYFFGVALALYSIPLLRGLAGTIFAGSGVVAVIFGFASRNALQILSVDFLLHFTNRSE